MLNKDWISGVLAKYENKPSDAHEWGKVLSVNADGSYQVATKGGTMRCESGCAASAGDVVWVCVTTDGKAVAQARKGGEGGTGGGGITFETDPTVPSWAKQPTKPIYTAAEVGALPANTFIPTVPTKVSAFSNDAGYLTAIPGEYVTETELTAKKYLTAVPAEYVTETELAVKGYATTTAVNSAQETANNALSKVDTVKETAEGAASAAATAQEGVDSINDIIRRTGLDIFDGEAKTIKGWTQEQLAYYVASSELAAKGYLTSIPSEYITESELKAKGYITAVPSEYVTETELSNKGYATQTWVTGRGYITGISKADVTNALGYTPPTTNTTYGVVSTTADGLAPKRDGSTTKFLRADGTWAVPPDNNTTYTLGSFGITATAAQLNAAYSTATAAQGTANAALPKAGGTMTGQLFTSFRNSVAMGSYGAAASTIPNLLDELRYSSGCMGSVSIGAAYTNGSVTIGAGWYNFVYSPHRNGGANGAASGDNHLYGTLLLFGMTVGGANYRIRYANGISEVARVAEASDLDSVRAVATAASTTAASAKSTADSANTAATSAKSTASTAQSLANSALSKADAALLKSGGTITGSLSVTGDFTSKGNFVLEPPTGEGGQILLNAATDDMRNNGILIDTANGDFRIIGLESRDGTSRPGIGSVFGIDPYDMTITGGYSFDGTSASANKENVTVLYSNATGTTGTVTLAQSAANFSRIDIIAGWSDCPANSVTVYAPNGKTVDVPIANVTESSWNMARVRYAISGTTMTASNNYRATGSGNYSTNQVYCKAVIGYK